MTRFAARGLPMSEAAWQRLVIDYAHAFGWRVGHFRPVRVVDPDGTARHLTPVQADGAGFPDLVLAKAGRVIFAELKSDTGRVSAEQSKWLAALGIEIEGGWDEREFLVRVWRPADEAEVVATLRGEG